MRLAPLWPANRLAQVGSTPQPRGVTSPSPVTTTRRNCMVGCLILPRLAGGLGQEGDGIAKGLDRLGGIVGNLDRKFFLERHHQLDLVKRIRAKVVDEAGLLGDRIRIDIEVFHNDLADPISDSRSEERRVGRDWTW